MNSRNRVRIARQILILNFASIAHSVYTCGHHKTRVSTGISIYSVRGGTLMPRDVPIYFLFDCNALHILSSSA